MFLGSLYCKQYGPRLDCSQVSSLIRAHSVGGNDKIYSKAICRRPKIQTTFSGQKHTGGIRVNFNLLSPEEIRRNTGGELPSFCEGSMSSSWLCKYE